MEGNDVRKPRMDLITGPIEAGSDTMFISSPGDYLVKTIVKVLSETKQWKALFDTSIDEYEREDYSMRELPALRVYNEDYQAETQSYFVTGDIKMDIIFPVDLHRNELQSVADIVSNALLQEFRRTPFFNAVNSVVPGLNELGKIFSVNKALMFNFADTMVPLTQVTANFRLDLREWDEYLEKQGRTTEDPFEVTLKRLQRIANTIRGLNDDGTKNVDVATTQNISQET